MLKFAWSFPRMCLQECDIRKLQMVSAYTSQTQGNIPHTETNNWTPEQLLPSALPKGLNDNAL